MNDLITKLDQILVGLTSCRLDYQPREFINPNEWEESELRRLKTGDFRNISTLKGRAPETYGIPVVLHDKFAGLAVVRGPLEKSPLDPSSLAELLAALIEMRMNTEARSNALSSFEERIRVQEGLSGNVTPLRPTRLSQVRMWLNRLEDEEARETAKSRDDDARDFASPLLIEDVTPEEGKRIAIERHEKSGRWAFLSITDLAPETFESPDGLQALGGVTLFVEDLSTVPTSQQLRLAELLSRSLDEDTPTVIACIKAENRDKVMPHLLELLQPYKRTKEMEINRPYFIPYDLRLLDQDQAPVQ